MEKANNSVPLGKKSKGQKKHIKLIILKEVNYLKKG